jgi:hypothetical protein
MQINHSATRPKRSSILRTHYRTAASGQHDSLGSAKVFDNSLLALTKTLLTLNIKDPGNIRTGSLLDFLIGVFKRQAQLFSQQPPDGAFTSPHRTNQDQISH